jgi:hypothetical protein
LIVQEDGLVCAFGLFVLATKCGEEQNDDESYEGPGDNELHLGSDEHYLKDAGDRPFAGEVED